MTRRDRSLLGFAGAGLLALFFVIALLSPSPDEANPVPAVDLTGSHGARAAWDMLHRSGRSIERWDGPLADLPAHVDRNTTVVFADPDLAEAESGTKVGAEAARPVVQAVLAHGARVLATGWAGGLLLAPEGLAPAPLPSDNNAPSTPIACEAQSRNQPPAIMHPEAVWKGQQPGLEVLLRCAGGAAAVRFPSGAGQAVWLGASDPLQNRSITEGGNLELLLNSLGPGRRIVWDESLHAGPHSATADLWSAPVAAGALQLGLLGLLLLFSFARRSGPLRADPATHRHAQGEFAQALGSLYRRAGVAQQAAETAYSAFRRTAEQHTGVPASATLHDGASRPAVLGRAAEQYQKLTGRGGALRARDALALVQALHDDEAALRARSDAGASNERKALAEHRN